MTESTLSGKRFAQIIAQIIKKNEDKNEDFKNLPKLEEDELDSNYKHLTFKVSNILEYIDVIRALSMCTTSPLEELAFRGMSNSKWELIPSLGRLPKDSDVMEQNMVNEFLTLRPEAFPDSLSKFDILAKMQHYGLPTRLLDFTSNPLVALYFACKKRQNSGRVVCTKSKITPLSLDIAKCICRLYKSYRLKKDSRPCSVEELMEKRKVNLFEYLREVYLLNGTIICRARYENDRIKNQSGMLMVFTNELRYDGDTTKTDEKKKKIEERIEKIKKLAPDTVNKEFIESIENKCGIQLFPGDFDKKGHLPYFGKEEPDKIFKDCFVFKSELRNIETDKIKNDFCSIIVKDEFKGKILYELATIGIDTAFLFPELEYTAQKIKAKYRKEDNFMPEIDGNVGREKTQEITPA